jgi:hypothetical protein
MPALLLAALAHTPTRLLAVTQEPVEGRASVTIVALGPLEDVSVRREGPEIVIALAAEAPEGFTLPQAVPPAEELRLQKVGSGLEIRVRVPNIPYEIKRDGSRLRLLLGLPVVASSAGPDVASLYPRLFPTVSGDQGLSSAETFGATAPSQAKEGLFFGSLSLRPSVTATYVDASATLLATPQPVSERYYETRPRLGLEAPFGNGQFTAAYEARIRGGSSLSVLKSTSHEADASADLPVGPRLNLRISDHYFRGALETSEIDPGAEYFFNLSAFHKNDLSGQARIEAGSRLFLEFGGSWNTVRVNPPSAFFSYDDEHATAALGLELGPNLRTALEYSYILIPFQAARPQIESHAHSVDLSLRGDLTPLTKVELAVGYRDEATPRAGPGGQNYRGLIFSAGLTRELSPGSNVTLSGSRTTLPSSFQNNGFYISTATELDLALQVPLRFAFHGGAGYRWNDYRVATLNVGVPRSDRIFGYSAGLGRPLTRWCFVRVDYHRERRTSDLAGFGTQTHAFSAQIGLGYVGAAGQP